MGVKITIEQRAELETQLRQKLRLTPQLEAQLRILTMPIEELEERIIKEAEENPFIEIESEEKDIQKEISEELRGKENEYDKKSEHDEEIQKDWEYKDFQEQEFFESIFENMSNPHIRNPEIEKYMKDVEDNIPSDESLEQKLVAQIEAKFQGKKRKIALAILSEIDEKGYLVSTPEEIVEKLKKQGIETSYLEVEEVRRKIMSEFDPPGIASKDLHEFLMFMLKSKDIDSSEKIEEIVGELTKEKISELMKKYGGLIEEIYRIEDKKQKSELLKSLREKIGYEDPKLGKIIELIRKDIPPYPTFVFRKPEYFGYKVKADVEVFEDEGKIYVYAYTPKVKFISLLSEDGDEKEIFELTWYIKSKKEADGEKKRKIDELVWRAKVLYEGVKMRKEMLEKICRVIFSKQIDFLRTGDEKSIKPLTLKDISEECKISEGNISKTIKGKYVKTPYGIFPIKKFLSVGVGENKKVSQKQILQEIAEIIRNEDKENPISDSEIAKIIEEKLGVKIARRTVVKYRQKLGIKNMEERKKLYAQLIFKK